VAIGLKCGDARFPIAPCTRSVWGEIRIVDLGRVKTPFRPRPLRNRGLGGGFPRWIGCLVEAEKVKPEYSSKAYQVDRNGKKRWLWRHTPGIASEFLHHLPDLLAKRKKPMMLYCRASSDKQKRRGNLGEGVDQAVEYLETMGYRIGRNLFVFDGVESSRIEGRRPLLERAIEEAKKRNGIVVAMHRDRFIRSSSFDGRNKTEAPTIYEYMQLKRLAGDAPLATIRPPDAPARSDQIKRGQAAKGNRGGRPFTRKWKKRRLARIGLARKMRAAGRSYQDIADKLNARQDNFSDQTAMTVYNWLRRAV